MKKMNNIAAVVAWSGFAESLLDFGRELLAKSSVDDAKNSADPRVLALLLLVRTHSIGRGTMVLLKGELVVEARVLARACIENMFTIAALCEDGEGFVKMMADHDIRHRRSLGENVLKFQGMRGDELNQSVREMLRWIKENRPSAETITPKDVAEMGVLKDMYIPYQKLSADAAHPTTETLSRYLTGTDAEGNRVINLLLPMNPQEYAETAWYLCMALMGVYAGVIQLLGGSSIDNKFVALGERYQSLYQEYVAESKTGT